MAKAKKLTGIAAVKERFLRNPRQATPKMTVYESFYSDGDIQMGVIHAGQLGYRVSIGSNRSINFTVPGARSLSKLIGGGETERWAELCDAVDQLRDAGVDVVSPK